MSDEDRYACIAEECDRDFDTEIGMKVHFTLTHEGTGPWVENRDYVPLSEYYDKCVDEKGRDCHICQGSMNIRVHHIDGDRHNNEIDNLIPVCGRCHSKMHHGSEGYEEWYELIAPEARMS